MTVEFDDMDLMAFADGELSQARAQRVSKYVESSPEARAKLASLGFVSEGVRTYLELATDQSESRLSSMWEQVERSMEAERGATPDATDSATERGPKPESSTGGVWERLRLWLKGPQGYLATGFVSAAVAAAIVLMVYTPKERIVERTVAVPAISNTNDIKPTNLRSTPASLDYLQVVGGSSTVLTVGGDDKNSPTTVIWVTDIEDASEGPI